MAKGLNRMMGRKGRVFDDRYHARVLRTPTEVRHAIHYVLFALTYNILRFITVSA